jgi:hypothetical protein
MGTTVNVLNTPTDVREKTVVFSDAVKPKRFHILPCTFALVPFYDFGVTVVALAMWRAASGP